VNLKREEFRNWMAKEFGRGRADSGKAIGVSAFARYANIQKAHVSRYAAGKVNSPTIALAVLVWHKENNKLNEFWSLVDEEVSA